MIKRNKQGKLFASNLDIQIFFDELFDICKNEKEVLWVYEILEDNLEMALEDKFAALDNE